MALECELTPPDLNATEDLTRFAGGAPANGSQFYDVLFSGLTWRHLELSGIEFSRVFIDKADFAKSKLRDSSLLDVRAKLTDLSNADWVGIEMHRVELLSARMTGFNGAEGRFLHTLFHHCRADYAVFHSSKLERCRFEKCSLKDATFESATLKYVVFRDCDLTNARFIGARLEDVDVRGSRLDGLAVDGSLKGLTIDVTQSPVIAALTGVRIADI